MTPRLDRQTAGVALAVGYVALIGVLFRDPSAGLSAATQGVVSAVLFILLPILGLASGVYVYVGGPFRTALGFVTASYLGTLGMAVATIRTTSPIVTVVTGLTILALAVLALVGVLRSTLGSMLPEL